jgi:hypothetical protein
MTELERLFEAILKKTHPAEVVYRRPFSWKLPVKLKESRSSLSL